MRVVHVLAAAILLTACSSTDDATPDGGAPRDDAGTKDATLDVDLPDTGTDAGLDAGDADAAPDASSCPKTLLVGGVDVIPQGWSIVSLNDFELSYAGDSTVLKTSTTSGARQGGELLLSYPGAYEAGKPFRLQVVMRVDSVGQHNQADSAAAILGSFTGPIPAPDQRSQMLYLDAAEIGWADNSNRFATSVVDNAYHTYELSVDAANVARVSVDGAATPLTRSNFVTNGTIAIGDQTNDPNVDAVTRIRSVTRLCP